MHPQWQEHGGTQIERTTVAARSTWVSISVNTLLSIVQIVVGVIAKSQALVADGIHSLSDLVSDFVVLWVNRHSHKQADSEHPYGHYRFETAASLLIGVLLLAVGLGMMVSAIDKLQQPQEIAVIAPVALWVAFGTLIAKELLFRYLLRTAKKVNSTMLLANAWHSRSDAASSLVVSIGLAGSLLGYPVLDPLAALMVGIMVGKMGWRFGWNALNDLMDRSIDTNEIEAMRATLLKTPGVLNVHDLRTRKVGDMILADVHLGVDASITVDQGHAIAVTARALLLKHHRVLDLMTHIDPVKKTDSEHKPGA
jgi:cation diffusion facilitator family transporter